MGTDEAKAAADLITRADSLIQASQARQKAAEDKLAAATPTPAQVEAAVTALIDTGALEPAYKEAAVAQFSTHAGALLAIANLGAILAEKTAADPLAVGKPVDRTAKAAGRAPTKKASLADEEWDRSLAALRNGRV